MSALQTMLLLSNYSPVTLQSLSPSWLTHPLELDSFSSFLVPAPSGMVGVSIADCALPGCWFILSLVHWSYWRGNLTTDAWVFFMDLLHPLCCDTSLVVVMGCLFSFWCGSALIFFLCKGSPSVIRQVPVARLLIPAQIFQQPSAFSS